MARYQPGTQQATHGQRDDADGAVDPPTVAVETMSPPFSALSSRNTGAIFTSCDSAKRYSSRKGEMVTISFLRRNFRKTSTKEAADRGRSVVLVGSDVADVVRRSRQDQAMPKEQRETNIAPSRKKRWTTPPTLPVISVSLPAR